MFKNYTRAAKDVAWPMFLILVGLSAIVGPKYFLLAFVWVPGMMVYVVSDHAEKRRISLVMLFFLGANALRIIFDSHYPANEIYWLVNKYLNIVILAFALEPIADDIIEKCGVDGRVFIVIQVGLYAAVLFVYTQVIGGHAEHGGPPFYTRLMLAEDFSFGALTAVTIAMFKNKSPAPQGLTSGTQGSTSGTQGPTSGP